MLMASPPPVGYCNSPAVALDTTQALLARLPAAQVGSGAGRCPAFLRLRSPSKDRPPSGAPCLALHRAVFPTTTASADSCRPIPTPFGCLFVGPALCLQLSSGPASRRVSYPCCSANGSHHQGP